MHLTQVNLGEVAHEYICLLTKRSITKILQLFK